MKIGHAADLHFGMVTHGRPGAGGVNSRILDVERTWSAAVDAFLEAQVDVVIVAGDIFHSPHPDAESLARFAKHLGRIDCPVVLIAGNHERAAHPGRSCVLESFAHQWATITKDIGPRERRTDAKIHVSTHPEVVHVADLRIATLPSVSRHYLASLMDYFVARSTIDQTLMEQLQVILASLATQGPDVLALHWPIQGSILSTEADISIIDEPVIPLAALKGPWRWIAAGHIHKHQVIPPFGSMAETGWSGGAYAGSIDRMNFGEEGERKGVWIVDLEDGEHATFVDVPATRFVTIDIHAFDPADGLDVEDAIVRVRGHMGPSDTPDTFTNIRSLMEGEWGARSVVFDVKRDRPTTSRAMAVEETVDPLAGLDQWMVARAIPKEDQGRLRALAADLMEGGS